MTGSNHLCPPAKNPKYLTAIGARPFQYRGSCSPLLPSSMEGITVTEPFQIQENSLYCLLQLFFWKEKGPKALLLPREVEFHTTYFTSPACLNDRQCKNGTKYLIIGTISSYHWELDAQMLHLMVKYTSSMPLKGAINK